MKITTKAKKIQQKIRKIVDDRSTVDADFAVYDNSIQAELRLYATWSIRFPVDQIHVPRDLSRQRDDLWCRLRSLEREIDEASRLAGGNEELTARISARSKSGAARREQAKAEFIVKNGQEFLAAYRKATGKRALARVRKRITALQAEQKKLLPELRRANSAYLARRRREKEARLRADAEAIASGEFWRASEDAVKAYFSPPFAKNYLSDVSARHRAALFLECESVSFKTAYGNWGHKLAGTGRGYLCGIDDNGDEWGFVVELLPQVCDDFGDLELTGTVEEAMAEAFDVAPGQVRKAFRQGDLLFTPAAVEPGTIEFRWADEWEIRESHCVVGDFERNGRYIRNARPVAVEHTSHATVVLPPGTWRLHTLDVPGVDVD